jgi:hypothetical protein
MKRVAIWNNGPVPEELGGGTRGNNAFNFAFDLPLLSEEVKEFYKALANNDIVEMVDAYCDVRFVWEGIEFKYGCISYDYNDVNNWNFLNTNEQEFRAIEVYKNRHRYKMLDLLETDLYGNESDDSYDKTLKLLDAAFNIVCEANEQKGTIKDANNKTMKGPKWVNPADSIRELLIANGVKVC